MAALGWLMNLSFSGSNVVTLRKDALEITLFINLMESVSLDIEKQGSFQLHLDRARGFNQAIEKKAKFILEC